MLVLQDRQISQFRSVYIHVKCIPNIHDQGMKFVRQARKFARIFHSDVIYVFRQEQSLFSMNKQNIPNSVLLSHPTPIRTSSNCLSHQRPASGCPYKFRSRGTTGSSMSDQDLVLTVVDEMCFFSISAQRQTSGLTACAEYPFARVCHAAQFPSKRPAVAKHRDTARQAAASTERP